MRSRTWRHAACVLGAAALCGLVAAGDIYRWVDEQGRVQMSDRPPPRSSGQVTRQDARRDEVAPGRRKAAQDRAARDRAFLENAQADRDKAAERSPQPRAVASSRFADESDPSLPTRASAEDCRLWRLEYRRNEACIAPFRTARGGIKPEAFSVCGPELLDPEFECGGRR